MNIIAVDDEKHALHELEKAIRHAVKDACVNGFDLVSSALDYASNNKVDIAFLDIELAGMNGLHLAKKLKDIYGKTNIIFVTGYSKYMGDAFALHASGYVMKPINPARVLHEIENIRHPVMRPDKGIRVQCFGNFAIFVDGSPVLFGRTKSMEILAYLVDRKGASITKKELAAVLWENEDYSRSVQSHLHILIADMLQALKNAGADDIIIKHRGQYALDTKKIICDYYNYEKGDASAVNNYHGEYMSNYSWAEFKIGLLNKKNK